VHDYCFNNHETAQRAPWSLNSNGVAKAKTRQQGLAARTPDLQKCDMTHKVLRHSREEFVMNRLQLSPTLAACYKLLPTQKERAVHTTNSRTAQLF
jgi:hypothetical protein